MSSERRYEPLDHCSPFLRIASDDAVKCLAQLCVELKSSSPNCVLRALLLVEELLAGTQLQAQSLG